jgi:hypothetical protein
MQDDSKLFLISSDIEPNSNPPESDVFAHQEANAFFPTEYSPSIVLC